MKSPPWVVLVGMAAMLGGLVPVFPQAQAPAAPAPQAPPSAQTPAPEKPKKQKYSHTHDFLIMGTIFDPKGYAFPGVQFKVRRNSERKFRWEDYTNSRGDFAVRVPQGSQYEMVVHAKGFEDQTRELDAKTGVSEARLVFRMEPEGGKKK
ncbi:MAG: carboxypeptidase-like regulatory domain-containing protein [Candidatus Acidiferrales bacterium]